MQRLPVDLRSAAVPLNVLGVPAEREQRQQQQQQVLTRPIQMSSNSGRLD